VYALFHANIRDSSLNKDKSLKIKKSNRICVSDKLTIQYLAVFFSVCHEKMLKITLKSKDLFSLDTFHL